MAAVINQRFFSSSFLKLGTIILTAWKVTATMKNVHAMSVPFYDDHTKLQLAKVPPDY